MLMHDLDQSLLPDTSGLRVLLVLDSYEQDHAMAELATVAERLVAVKGLSIESAALFCGGELEPVFQNMGIATQVLDAGSVGGTRRLFRRAAELGGRKRPPSLVQSPHRTAGLVARVLSGRMGRPPVVLTHAADAGWDGRLRTPVFLRRMLDRWSSGDIAAWVVPFEEMRARVAALGTEESRIHRIPSGVDALKIFPPSEASRLRNRRLLSIGEDIPLIVSAGSLTEAQRPLLVLEAFAEVRLALPNAMLVFMGDGPLEGAVREDVTRRGLEESVRMIGHLSVLGTQILSAADVVVDAAQDEAFPMLVATAMAASRALVVMDAPGRRELIRDGVTGRILKEVDPRRFGQLITSVLANPEVAAMMGAAARDAIMAEHEVGRTADEYLMLWRSLVPEARVGNTIGESDAVQMPVFRSR